MNEVFSALLPTKIDSHKLTLGLILSGLSPDIVIASNWRQYIPTNVTDLEIKLKIEHVEDAVYPCACALFARHITQLDTDSSSERFAENMGIFPQLKTAELPSSPKKAINQFSFRPI